MESVALAEGLPLVAEPNADHIPLITNFVSYTGYLAA